MKEQFVCKECGTTFDCAENLSKHVKHHGINNKTYYDKWFKGSNEGNCMICGRETKFNGIQKGYRKYCSRKCSAIGVGNINGEIFKRKREKIKESFEHQCLECNEKFETSIKLNNHIIKEHGKREYYDKHIKKEKDGICKVCGEETSFTGRLVGEHSGYEMCCSKNCREIYKKEKRTQTNLKKYNVENPFQSEEIKEKIKQSFIEHYGVDNNMKSSKGRKEFKKSMMKNHGVEWPLQNKEILEKSQKSAKTIKQFKDTDLWYQGSYELDFLEKYYEIFPDIKRGPSIKYKYKEKNKVYHPDFYIPSKNLIIEIKSSWTLTVDLEIKEKKKATISNGFKYLMILDKNYNKILI